MPFYLGGHPFQFRTNVHSYLFTSFIKLYFIWIIWLVPRKRRLFVNVGSIINHYSITFMGLFLRCNPLWQYVLPRFIYLN